MTIRDLYDEVIDPETGQIKLVLLKKNVRTKWFCRDLSQIATFAQVYNNKGNLRPGKTIITHNGEELMLDMKYKDVKTLLEPRTIKGFTK